MPNNLFNKKFSLKEKIGLIIFGFFLFFVLLEIALRLGGFILLSIQEYRNQQKMKQKGAYRIMCLGESTTAGSYPVFLEEILNQRKIGIKFSVIDKGISATNTTLIVANLESDINKYHPDMVVAMMGINDKEKYVPYKICVNSRAESFFKSFKIYKLVKLLRLHILAKANRDSCNIPGETNLDVEETQAYLSSDEIKEACFRLIATEESLSKAIQLSPKDPPVYLKLGLFYQGQGRLAEAENSFRRVLELDPKNYRAYIELGWVYRKQEEFIQAEELWKKALELDPKSDLAYNALSWLYRKQAKLAQAEAISKKSLEFDPKNRVAYSGLGRLYNRQGKFIQAEESFKKVIELDAKSINAKAELGQFYLEQGKLTQAEEVFKEVLTLNPKNIPAFGAMSVIYEKMGKPGLAKKYSKEVIRLGLEYYQPVVVNNYRKLKEILDRKKIRLACMQYPVRNIGPLRKIFEGNDKGIIFIDNEVIFKNALKKNVQAKLFRDMFGGDFGHCTVDGNKLLAENVARVILREVFNNPEH